MVRRPRSEWRSGARSWILAIVVTAACSPSAERIRVSGYAPATEASLREAGWSTDLTRLIVPLDALSMGPLSRDAFPVVTAPEHAFAVDLALGPAAPMLVVRGDSEVKAWPLTALLDAELVLDEVEGVPVAVTFCSLCGSALVWERRVEGHSLEFGVSGLLLSGNSLLYDRESESLWRQLDGRAVAGRHAGRRLAAVPSFVISWGALRDARPDAVVMTSSPGRAPVRHLTSIDVGSNRAPEWLELSCPNPFDPLLAFASNSAPLELGGDPVRNEDDFVVFEDLACASPYGAEDSPNGRRRSGSAVAFGRVVGGRRLTFERHDDGIQDRETHSRWNLLGEAVAGPLRGTRLPLVAQVSAFRFALEGIRTD